MQEFSDKELWRMLTLYGLNTATYKIALGQCLCNFTEADKTRATMEMLAKEFDRSFGASEQAQRYAAGSNLFQRVL